MKRVLLILLSVMLVVSLAACGESSTAAETETSAGSAAAANTADGDDDTDGEGESADAGTTTIKTFDATREIIDLEVPYNPTRIAVLDLAVLDILDNLGLGDRVVGVAKGSSIEYLQSYVENDDLENLGSIKTADLEAVMRCDPEIIFIGGRLSSIYDELSEIAPVVFLPTSDDGVVTDVRNNANAIASLFGLEEQVDSLMADFDERIAALAAIAEGKTAIVGMVNAGGFGVLGNDGRCSIIGVEIGFENMSDAEVTSTHGNESSFELLVEVDPDYIFVMDRDAAIGTEGAQLAPEVIENELVMMTSAYANGNIIYLEHSNVWYTAEGGVTALDYMLSDLEDWLL